MARVVVIGAGVIGLWCAYALRRRGHDVIVIERGEPGGACSAGNAGWVVPSLSEPLPAPGLVRTSLRWMLNPESPLYIAPTAVPGIAGFLWRFWRHCNAASFGRGVEALRQLNRLTMAGFDELEHESGETITERRGLLWLFLSEAAMRAALASHSHSDLDEPVAMARTELQAFEPAISREVAAGLWFRQDRHLRPERLCALLAARLRANGAEIREREAVVGVVTRGDVGCSIRTEHAECEADHFVIAAGVWSRAMGRHYGVSLPVYPGKGYSLTYPSPQVRFSRPLDLVDARVAVTPFADGLRLAGTMELSDMTDRIRQNRVEAILRGAERYLDARLPVGEGRVWMGMRPLTPDGLPLIGRLPGWRNVYVATGHAMLGVTLAPATAGLVADVVDDRAVDAEVRPFDPARFAS